MERDMGVGDGQSNGYARQQQQQQPDAGATSGGVDLMALLNPSRGQGAT